MICGIKNDLKITFDVKLYDPNNISLLTIYKFISKYNAKIFALLLQYGPPAAKTYGTGLLKLITMGF